MYQGIDQLITSKPTICI